MVIVKLPLGLTKYHAMETYGWVEIQLHAFLTSALEDGEWSTSRSDRFIPKVKGPWYTLNMRLCWP
jgi:hypothetical protein